MVYYGNTWLFISKLLIPYKTQDVCQTLINCEALFGLQNRAVSWLFQTEGIYGSHKNVQ